ncbi:hypothetical protein [Paraflavitalea speifideaquila]|uniref:hypothetical protein n=1 Tax=Paraflavitalea speifideaquila TaxID=3076558 RepID=UPI0028E5FDD7|nr:hypothetical protein [Paraflavitalea speifideiaquila]
MGNMLSNNPYFTNFISVSTAGDKYNLYASFQNQSKGGIAGPISPDTRRTALLNVGIKPNKNIEAEVTLQYFNRNTPPPHSPPAAQVLSCIPHSSMNLSLTLPKNRPMEDMLSNPMVSISRNST